MIGDFIGQFLVAVAVVLVGEAAAGVRARPWPRRILVAVLFATVIALGGTALHHSEELFGLWSPWWLPLVFIGFILAFSVLVEAVRARRRKGYRGTHAAPPAELRD